MFWLIWRKEIVNWSYSSLFSSQPKVSFLVVGLHRTESWIIHDKTSASVYTADGISDINMAWSNTGVPFVSLVSHFSASTQPSKHSYFLSCALFCSLSCMTSHQYLQRWEESGIRDGIHVIKPVELPVDLRQDLNAACLHGSWGDARNLKECPFNLIHCQKQSHWGARPGGRLARVCFIYQHVL